MEFLWWKILPGADIWTLQPFSQVSYWLCSHLFVTGFGQFNVTISHSKLTVTKRPSEWPTGWHCCLMTTRSEVHFQPQPNIFFNVPAARFYLGSAGKEWLKWYPIVWGLIMLVTIMQETISQNLPSYKILGYCCIVSHLARHQLGELGIAKWSTVDNFVLRVIAQDRTKTFYQYIFSSAWKFTTKGC